MHRIKQVWFFEQIKLKFIREIVQWRLFYIQDDSYLTFFSSGGLIFGIVNILGNFGTVFCDQAYWQSSVAAKPLQGVWGFITGGLTW